MCFHTLHAEQHDDALRPANNNNANSWKHWHAESADLWLHIARHPLKLTHTHTDAHSRKQRRSDWREAAEKNAAITQKVVCKISERSREQKPQLPCSPTIVVVVVAAALIVGSIVLASFEWAVGLVKELAVANLSVECHYNDLLSCCAEKYAMLFIKSATTEQQ